MKALYEDPRAWSGLTNPPVQPIVGLHGARFQRGSIWPMMVSNIVQSFEDLWILVAFNTLFGLALLLIEVSDSGRPSVVTACLCLLVPPLANALLIILEGVLNTFAAPAWSPRGVRNGHPGRRP